MTPNPGTLEKTRGGGQAEATDFQDTLKTYIQQVDKELKQAGVE